MRLQRELLVELLRIELPLVVLRELAQGPRDVLDVVENALGVVVSLRESVLEVSLARCVLLDLEELGYILLQALDLLFEVVDFLVNDVQGPEVILPVLNLDLHEQLVVLAVLGQLLCLIKRLVLLAAHFDSGVDIKYRLRLVLTLRSLDQLRDLVLLLELHITVEEQSRIVLVIITHRVEALHARCLLRRRLDQLLKVLDQVWEVLHLDVSLDHVAWIEVADGLQVLGQCLLGLVLDCVQLVAMLLTYLCIYLSRKFGADCNALGLLEKSLLQQVLYLQVVLHLNELEHSKLPVFVHHLQEYGFLLNLNLKDLRIRRVKQ